MWPRYEWDQMRLALGELSDDDNISVEQLPSRSGRLTGVCKLS